MARRRVGDGCCSSVFSRALRELQEHQGSPSWWRVGDWAAVPLCVPQAVQRELQGHQGSLSWWPLLTQHLSLTRDIPGGLGAGSERREESRRT